MHEKPVLRFGGQNTSWLRPTHVTIATKVILECHHETVAGFLGTFPS